MACARSPAPEPKTNPPTTRLSNPQTTHSQTAMTEKSIVIYHNSRCSKSRSVCALVSERKIDAKIVEYLETPPNKAELRALLRKLGMKPGELVRRGERIYQETYANREMSDEQWLDALVAHPILIERPIVVCSERAVIGRPPEKVLTLINAER